MIQGMKTLRYLAFIFIVGIAAIIPQLSFAQVVCDTLPHQTVEPSDDCPSNYSNTYAIPTDFPLTPTQTANGFKVRVDNFNHATFPTLKVIVGYSPIDAQLSMKASSAYTFSSATTLPTEYQVNISPLPTQTTTYAYRLFFFNAANSLVAIFPPPQFDPLSINFVVASGGGVNPQVDQGPGGDVNQPGGTGDFSKLENPLPSITSIPDFIKRLIDAAIIIGIPIVALAIIYSGFLLVTARGDTTKLKKGKQAFLAAVIGGAILLGAWVLAKALDATIKSITQ